MVRFQVKRRYYRTILLCMPCIFVRKHIASEMCQISHLIYLVSFLTLSTAIECLCNSIVMIIITQPITCLVIPVGSSSPVCQPVKQSASQSVIPILLVSQAVKSGQSWFHPTSASSSNDREGNVLCRSNATYDH